MKTKGKKYDRSSKTSFTDTEQKLWDTLRAKRLELATIQSVAPYMIFHDSTLRQMLTDRPTNPDALLGISGVGQAKLTRYGDEFLEVIRSAE